MIDPNLISQIAGPASTAVVLFYLYHEQLKITKESREEIKSLYQIAIQTTEKSTIALEKSTSAVNNNTTVMGTLVTNNEIIKDNQEKIIEMIKTKNKLN